jgi:hypothetical protein
MQQERNAGISETMSQEDEPKQWLIIRRGLSTKKTIGPSTQWRI